MNEIGIGSTVWVFDENCRVYVDNRCVYREHWHPQTIDGETSKSWIIKSGKFPKKPDERGHYLLPRGRYSPQRVVLSAQEVEDDVWKRVHANYICDVVRSCDAGILRQIAALVGYQP